MILKHQRMQVYPGSTISALNDLSLGIEKNKITTVLGHSDAGKSTFIAAICGLKTQSHLYYTTTFVMYILHYNLCN